MLTWIISCHSAELRQISIELLSFTYHSACIYEHQLLSSLLGMPGIVGSQPPNNQVILGWEHKARVNYHINYHTHMCMSVYMNKHVSHQISNNMYMLGSYQSAVGRPWKVLSRKETFYLTPGFKWWSPSPHSILASRWCNADKGWKIDQARKSVLLVVMDKDDRLQQWRQRRLGLRCFVGKINRWIQCVEWREKKICRNTSGFVNGGAFTEVKTRGYLDISDPSEILGSAI